MQGYIGLVRYSCGTIHSFNLDKGLKSLCKKKFGIQEKITWGDPSEVTCTKCQEILYKKYEAELNLNDQQYSFDYTKEETSNHSIASFNDSMLEVAAADDEIQLTAGEEIAEENTSFTTIEPVGTEVSTKDISISSNIEENTSEVQNFDNLELTKTEETQDEQVHEGNVPFVVVESEELVASNEPDNIYAESETDNSVDEVEHLTTNEANKNTSYVGGTPEIDGSYTFQSTTVEEMHKEISEETTSSAETALVNNTIANDTNNNDSLNAEKDNSEDNSKDDSEDISDNTKVNIGHLDNLDRLDRLDELNTKDDASEPVIILI
ncbi:hypothetical protein O0Q50_19925 [Priestia aryabhattai]|uniref:Uncharacterized protein n=1 Tax=Priestia aryabhattai TaxID=412384 RepID=A0AAX6NCI8_PRIAR|nr:hypothetical protein [Priestia aryabhattai]MDU9693446.1 hypothetical protein [Priestia aryabhattai]